MAPMPGRMMRLIVCAAVSWLADLLTGGRGVGAPPGSRWRRNFLGAPKYNRPVQKLFLRFTHATFPASQPTSP